MHNLPNRAVQRWHARQFTVHVHPGTWTVESANVELLNAIAVPLGWLRDLLKRSSDPVGVPSAGDKVIQNSAEHEHRPPAVSNHAGTWRAYNAVLPGGLPILVSPDISTDGVGSGR